MQLSDTPTTHILVRANTNSEFYSCDFAIITISEKWKQDQLRRLAVAKSFPDDKYFRSMCFLDRSVNFYYTNHHDLPDIDKLLGNRDWAFVEISDEELNEEELDEEEQFNCNLDVYRLVICCDGDTYYTAYGEYTGEEFWTEEFSLQELLEKL